MLEEKNNRADKNSFYLHYTGTGSTARRGTDQFQDAAELDIIMHTLDQTGLPRTIQIRVIYSSCFIKSFVLSHTQSSVGESHERKQPVGICTA